MYMYMFDNQGRGKIKNDKIQWWRMELACFDYDIIYRPGKDNSAADTLTRAFCNAISLDTLSSIHEAFHPSMRPRPSMRPWGSLLGSFCKIPEPTYVSSKMCLLFLQSLCEVEA